MARNVDSTRPLGRMCSAWETLLQKAAEDKERKFGRDAAAAMRYFRANAEEIWADENEWLHKAYEAATGRTWGGGNKTINLC